MARSTIHDQTHSLYAFGCFTITFPQWALHLPPVRDALLAEFSRNLGEPAIVECDAGWSIDCGHFENEIEETADGLYVLTLGASTPSAVDAIRGAMQRRRVPYDLYRPEDDNDLNVIPKYSFVRVTPAGRLDIREGTVPSAMTLDLHAVRDLLDAGDIDEARQMINETIDGVTPEVPLDELSMPAEGIGRRVLRSALLGACRTSLEAALARFPEAGAALAQDPELREFAINALLCACDQRGWWEVLRGVGIEPGPQLSGALTSDRSAFAFEAFDDNLIEVPGDEDLTPVGERASIRAELLAVIARDSLARTLVGTSNAMSAAASGSKP